MKGKIIIIYLVLFFQSNVIAQQLKGIILDEHKHPIPDVTVYVSQLKSGTSSNNKGEYAVKLAEGEYEILYRSLGYKEKNITVQIKGITTLNIQLEEQAYSIPEVIISKHSEDPANAIMRKVIAWSNYHLNQVSHYNSEVYLKGTLTFKHIPKLMQSRFALEQNGNVIKFHSGDNFVDESVNQIIFDAPKQYKHTIVSLHTSYPLKNNQPITPIDLIKSSIYEKQVFDQISPLAPSAFSEYKFHYEGFQKEGDLLIDKIRVTPIRESQQLSEGYLYIIEDLWCVYNLDLTSKQFWGNMNIKQQFSEIQKNVWLPVSDHFLIQADYMGVKIDYNYVASIKLSDIHINENLKGPTLYLAYKNEKTSNAEIETKNLQTNFTKKDLKKIIREQLKEHKLHNADTVKSLEIKEKKEYTMDSMALGSIKKFV